jgi:twitching motility protein PilT
VAIFGPGKRTVLQRVRDSDWKSPQELAQLLQELRGQKLKPNEFAFLVAHQDASARQLGTWFVQQNPSAATVEALIDEATGKAESARKNIVRSVLSLPAAEVAAAAEKLLSSRVTAGKVRLVWDVAFALPKDVGQRFVEIGLKSPIGAIRLDATKKLLEDRVTRKLTPQLLDLAHDEEPRVRLRVLEAFLGSPYPDVTDLMVDRALNDPSSEVKQLAFDELMRAMKASPETMRERIVVLLGANEADSRKTAIKILSAVYPPDEVLRIILDYARGLLGWIRDRIFESLRGFGDYALPVARLLGHGDAEMRVQALVLAQSMADPRLVGSVAKLLKDPDWWIRMLAADCLAILGSEQAVEPLIATLSDPDAKWAALEALAKIGSPRALNAIAEVLSDQRTELRLDAIAALSHFKDPRLVPILKRVVDQDPATVVRVRAAEALRNFGEHARVEVSPNESMDLRLPLDRLLVKAKDVGASDLHITAGEAPWVRVDGVLKPLEGHEVIDTKTATQWLRAVLDETRLGQLEENGEVDLCHSISEVGRFRGNVFRQRRGLCGTFRVIPHQMPTLRELRVPDHLREILELHQGIVILCGPAGCGKSSTLAAFINEINETKSEHVISLEDPVEFVHPPRRALIDQREVGKHTESFATGLRAALREDPDIVVVGEVRDEETVRLALTASETGHLVFATLHTMSAVQAIERVIEMFPPQEQPQVRMSLSEGLKYVIAQNLVPKSGGGRVAVFEILKETPSIGHLIREGQTFQIPNMMQIGKHVGMRTVDHSLEELLAQGVIDLYTAQERAVNKELFGAATDIAGGSSEQSTF